MPVNTNIETILELVLLNNKPTKLVLKEAEK